MQAAERAQRITLTPVQIVFRDRVADDFRTRTKRGIMLLDEMGLGKTMSVISAITAHPGFLEQHASFRVLWVVPRSTMTNVIAELGLMGLADVVQEYKSNMLELSVDDLQVHIWLITPDMLHNLHKAGKDERLTLVPPVLQDETLLATRDFSDVQLTNVFEEERQQTFQEEQQQQQKLEEKEDVSDAMAANHFDFFFGHEWDILAVDEADRIFAGAIKPVSRTQQYSLSFEWGHIRPSSRYIYQVKRDYVILMTGTPMKNSILDVAALAMMVNNDSATAFPRFWTDMESWTSAHFNAVRAICIRRERAHDLITFEKTETVAPLTPKQVERELEIIRSSNPEGRPVAALTVSIQSVTALRLNCLTADYKDGSLGEHDAVTRVAEALGKLVEEKQFMTDKVVVFCEFVRILEAIKLRLITYIKASKMPVDERIAYADSLKQATIFSGEESTARRDEIVARSRDAVDNVGDCVMFVSQRAGGIGLNFQFASHVICVGEWFQMQSENQAFDRVRRLGQLRHVVMNKFVSAGGFGIHAWMKRISRKKEKVSNAWLSILVNPDKVAWTEEEKAAIRELSHGLGLKARDAMLPTADVVLERDPPSDLVVTAAVESLLTAVDAQFATDFPYWPLDLMQSYYPNRSIHE
jgi:SNF2 family DNA or RNA helicase